MKCARCGKDAPYFTDSYDPVREENVTMYLCKDCQIEFTHKMAAFVRGDDEVARIIREAMDSKPIPILTPTGECFKDIAKVLDWLYTWGIHVHGMSTEIEATIKRIGGVAQPVKTYRCEDCANKDTDVCDGCTGPNELGAKPGKWEQIENCSTCKYDYSPINARCVGCNVILPVYPHGISVYQHWESKEDE